MTRSLEAVVFDLDTTLAVTARDRQTLLDDATAAVGLDPIERAVYLDAHGTVDATETRAPIFEHILPDDATASPTALAAAYREAIERHLEPVPGAADLIRTLRESYRVGLLTDGPRLAQGNKLDRLGWAELFDAVVITGTLPAGKPAAVAFETAAAELGVAPENAAYVGDRPSVDVDGADRVGFRTVQVRYPGGPDPHPAADATVDRDELAECLPGILSSL